MEHDDSPLAPSEYSLYDYAWHDYVGNASTTREKRDVHPWDIALEISKVLYALDTAVGLFTNTLLVVLVAISPSQRTVSNMYLMQRALSLILYLIYLAYSVTLVFSKMQYSFAGCVLSSIAVHVASVASLLFLMLYAIDSYLASRPQHNTLQYRRKVMKLTSAAAWFLAAAVGIPAYILTAKKFNIDNECVFLPLFSLPSTQYGAMSAFIQFVVPLVVVWVFVGLVKPLQAEEGNEGLNRRLLLALASLFTAMHGLFWIISIIMIAGIYHWVIFIFLPLSNYENVISPILVICLSEGLRQKVIGWLPGRHFESLPLQDM